MPKLKFELVAEMDDGTVHQLVADQRDFAKWEVQDFRSEARLQLKARFLGWSAMTRAGLTKATFDRFNDHDCVEVLAQDSDVEEDEGEQGLDPGRTTAGDGPTSPSPAALAKRSQKS